MRRKRVSSSFRPKGTPDIVIRIASVEKVLVILKRLILANCNAYRLMAYFMSPAIRGGVLAKDAQWEKGSIVVVKTGIWFVSAAKQISIPFKMWRQSTLQKGMFRASRRMLSESIMLNSGEVVSSLVLCPLSTLQVLVNFLKDTTKGMDMKGNELDAVGQQVAMLVYSGMDSHAIENMLNIPHKQLDEIYDRIIKLEIAEVITIQA